MAVLERDSQEKVPDRVVRMELISFFNICPDMEGTPEEVACRLGRSREQVSAQMAELERLRILERVDGGESPRYRYIPPIYRPLTRKNRPARGGAGSPLQSDGKAENGRGETRRLGDGKVEMEEDGVRMRLVLAAMRREGWKECLELLLDTIHRLEEVPCAAYLLVEGCSEIAWDCQRGVNGGKAGTSESRGGLSLLLEGDLLNRNGLLETAHHVKYLYPMEHGEAALVCVDRDKRYDIDVSFLEKLMQDFMPVVAEKRHHELMEERTAERLLQEHAYWSALRTPEEGSALESTLASLAKSMQAERVSILLRDEEGNLRTMAFYGKCRDVVTGGHGFRSGEGVAGWCVRHGCPANLIDARIDTRFVPGPYDDIENMLCSPIVTKSGEAIGAVCAVNKQDEEDGSKPCFTLIDQRLQSGVADALAMAFMDKGSRTKRLSRHALRDFEGSRVG